MALEQVKMRGQIYLSICRQDCRKNRIIRFDASGYGESEGLQEESSIKKYAEDLKAVLDYVKAEYKGKTWLVSASLGTYVVALLSPDNIEKTVFISPTPSTSAMEIKRLKERIASKPNGKVVENGISIFPRTTGEIQRIGPSFWKVLREFNVESAVTKYSKKTELVILIPLNDEILEHKDMSLYKRLPGAMVQELEGDHAFTNRQERMNLIKMVKKALER
jgi:pimeloyl-ACP methyl ester carboxylesterase